MDPTSENFTTIAMTTMDFNGTISMNFSSKNQTEELPSKPSVIEALVMYVICIGAFVSNIVVFFILPRLTGKIRTPTRYCMASLLITDSGVGLTVFITRTIYISSPKFYEEYICSFEGIAYSFLIGMTIVGLTLLNIDRVLVIIIPTKYDPWITARKCLIILLLLWIGITIRYIVTLILPPKIESIYLKGSYICIIKYDVKTTFTISGIVLLLVVPFLDCIASLIALTVYLLRHKRGTQREKSKTKESATVLSAIFLLSAFYFLMTAPFGVCVLIWQAHNGHPLNPTASFITTWLLACNSVVNPYIYLATMKSYRREFVKIISKLAGAKKRPRSDAADESRMSTHDDASL